MRFDAREERWISMEIKGVEGYFCDMRINRDTVPDKFHQWELADDDGDGMPCRYRNGILVNFYGTFLTTGELPVDSPDHQEGFINSENEWGFTGEQSTLFMGIEALERERMEEKK